jgi:hypothetical protein
MLKIISHFSQWCAQLVTLHGHVTVHESAHASAVDVVLLGQRGNADENLYFNRLAIPKCRFEDPAIKCHASCLIHLWQDALVHN